MVADVDALWVDAELGVGRPLRPVAAGCPTRPGAAGATLRGDDGGRRVGARAGRRGSPSRGRGQPRPGLGGGHRRWPVRGAGVRPQRERRCPRWSCRPSARSSRWCGSATTSWAGRWRPTCRRGPGGCTTTTTWSLVVPPWTPRHRCRSRVARSSGCSPRPRTGPRCRSTSSTAPARRRTAPPRPAVRLRRVRDQPQAVVSARRLPWLEQGGVLRGRQRTRRRRVRPRSGTTPGGSPPSRTASTTSSPAPTTSCETRRDQPRAPGDHGRLQRRAARWARS